ncbi:nucleotidyltransferase domain protein [Leptospira yanagawae serovar Saopaulo str. Sao Paulo = ATCC 700523]|uniref:Nucleotidyltransferase domain protein n=1 Tax=Leptospira yanagawae serovar Saopaulo str. Sao Paulo = ATCC 700523 TaxID=1249483 RepID=A0A5E8HFQ0_9LEPT|nr:nucleotidyltransferase domain-containing protein [Leptospira yanagawae]EOQ88816.1 nucleotidyltransferase domain protein [Leptospira yanagawae serovar Saopaulo str. Sao Paulo = ATCC 700523]
MENELEHLKNQIIFLVNPLKIILFGSRATLTACKNSDYDLLIIMPDGTNKREIAQYIYKKVDNIKISFDLVVATPETLKKYSNSRHLIYFYALQDGLELYAA